MPIIDIHHVQLAMPPGGEEVARSFYTGILGFEEVPKPSNLAKRGGVWFRANSVHLHLGIEADFRPSKKAHPAFEVDDLTAIEVRCKNSGHSIAREERLSGYDKIYVADPFGNRIELLQKTGAG